MRKALYILCALILVLNPASAVFADNSQTHLIIWSFTNELQHMIEKYYMPYHPEIDFTFVIYPSDGNAYTNRLDNCLFSHPTDEDAPDIFVLEAAFIKRYVDSDVTGDLKDIGLEEEDYSSVYPAVLDTGRDNATNQQKGLSWQACPTVMVYRASLAEKYLGVTSPEEFAEKVGDLDSFLATAREVNEASGGACKMITGSGDLISGNSNAAAWVSSGNQLTVSADMLNLTETIRIMEEENLTQHAEAWGETWFAGMRGENETLTYILPMWGLNYTLKPNCVQDWDAWLPDSEANISNATENGTYGDWRVVVGPVQANWGGVWIATNRAKVEQASDTKKAAMRDLFYFLTLDPDFLEQYANDTGDFVSNQDVIQNLTGQNDWGLLGGQDPLPVLNQSGQSIHTDQQTEYDEVIMNLWNTYVIIPYSHGEIDLKTAMQNFYDAVHALYPGMIINDPLDSYYLKCETGGYRELFTKTPEDRYFILPLHDEARLTLENVFSQNSIEPVYETDGEAISLENNIVKPVKSGQSRIICHSYINGEEDSQIIANFIVIDPQKTLILPDSLVRVESEAFRGTDAECLIMPANRYVIEKDSFAGCSSLKTVIFTGDPSGSSSPGAFGAGSSILFLSADGRMPYMLNPENKGLTNFTGFRTASDN